MLYTCESSKYMKKYLYTYELENRKNYTHEKKTPSIRYIQVYAVQMSVCQNIYTLPVRFSI